MCFLSCGAKKYEELEKVIIDLENGRKAFYIFQVRGPSLVGNQTPTEETGKAPCLLIRSYSRVERMDSTIYFLARHLAELTIVLRKFQAPKEVSMERDRDDLACSFCGNKGYRASRFPTSPTVRRGAPGAKRGVGQWVL